MDKIMNKGINVLSLFDGISCGQIALQRACIKVNQYFASEIDKNAIKVTQHNWPNTIQLGDVTKWREWNIDWEGIDLLCAGFPCQAWSFAGKQQGTNDPRGALAITLFEVFTFLKEKNPKLKFLFENVKMKKEHLTYLNNLFGVEPIEINSALVSAQNRKRLYWTNIPNISRPQDKEFTFKDIIDNDGPYEYWSTNRMAKFHSRFYVRKDTYRVLTLDSKISCLTVGAGHGNSDEPKIMHDGVLRRLTPLEWERAQNLPDGYTSILKSKNERRGAIGNGWTVDVIAHIFSFLPQEFKNE